MDAYGERQRHTFRGRPLFLDQRRYDVVRGLWAKHLVAHEVCLHGDNVLGWVWCGQTPPASLVAAGVGVLGPGWRFNVNETHG